MPTGWTDLYEGPRLRFGSERGIVAGDALAHANDRRTCGADGCTAVLSRYNLDEVCGAHGGWQDDEQPRRRRGDPA